VIRIQLQTAHGQDPEERFNKIVDYCRKNITEIRNKRIHGTYEADSVPIYSNALGGYDVVPGFQGLDYLGMSWRIVRISQTEILLETWPEKHESFLMLSMQG